MCTVLNAAEDLVSFGWEDVGSVWNADQKESQGKKRKVVKDDYAPCMLTIHELPNIICI